MSDRRAGRLLLAAIVTVAFTVTLSGPGIEPLFRIWKALGILIVIVGTWVAACLND